jgi:acetyltransferase
MELLSEIDQLFTPNAVAVFGASDSEGSLGGSVYRNLLAAGFQGRCYGINPKHEQVAERPCHRDLHHLNKRLDLALIATPLDEVPEILDQCGEYGVRAAVVYSGGFGRLHNQTNILQDKLLEAGRRNRIRVLGPKTLGVMRPHHKLNASFRKELARPGNVALVSQSRAVCTSMLDWSDLRRLGFSAVVSLGAAVDLDFGDILDFLALDGHTQSILLCVEGIRDARRFMSGLRSATRLKPVIVIKTGGYPAGARAPKSHIGAWAGSAEVFRAVMERAGGVQVEDLEQLFAAEQVFGAKKRMTGNRMAIVTNGGCPGVLAADKAVERGLRIPQLSNETQQRLEAALPDEWSRDNPVDLMCETNPERYQAAVEACLADPQVDGVLTILAPLGLVDPTGIARKVAEAAVRTRKPVLACWMGSAGVAETQSVFSDQGVPSFLFPHTAVEAMSFLADYCRNQKLLMQTPGPLSEHRNPDIEGARLIIEGVMAEGRKTLGSIEAKAVLSAFHIPTTQEVLTHSPNDALTVAQALGYPVVMKVCSHQIEHKSEVDGVRLDIADAPSVRRSFTEIVERVHKLRPEANIMGVTVEHMATVRAAREFMIGVMRDPVFGPVISFGAGGIEVEVLEDHAVGLPPLNDFVIETMIEHTRVARLMGACRYMPPMNRQALTEILQRVSELVCELPEVISMEINPLIGNDKDVVAVDARIRVDFRPSLMPPYGHMAIHPYPTYLLIRTQLPDGTDLVIRPVRPEDAQMEQDFVRGLSKQTKYLRFMQAIKELTSEMLVRFTQIDYDREMALIGIVTQENGDIEVGAARYMSRSSGEACEFAIVVADHWQGRGIGARLLRSLMKNARERGFRTINGEVLTVNTRMLALAKSLGFRVTPDRQNPKIMVATKVLL